MTGAYSFLPWLRTGLTTKIAGESGAGRATIPVQLELTGDALEAGDPAPHRLIEQPVQLYGPGDVIGIDPHRIDAADPDAAVLHRRADVEAVEGHARLAEARIPYISVMTDPTTGGVTASYAMLGDLNIGEPNALIGFAGPRVIEQTIRQTLPEGFQRSEFLLEHGMLDFIVDRSDMKDTLVKCLELLWDERRQTAAGSR